MVLKILGNFTEVVIRLARDPEKGLLVRERHKSTFGLRRNESIVASRVLKVTQVVKPSF